MQDNEIDFKKIESENVDADNKAISVLEEENSNLKNKIIKERFTWVFLLIFITDIFTALIYCNYD